MDVNTAMDWHPIKGKTKIQFHVMKIRSSFNMQTFTFTTNKKQINPLAPGDFAEKRVLKLVEWFSGHCRAIKS